MILDVTQVVLLLICTGLLAFVCHRLTKQEETPEDLPKPNIHAIRDTLIEYIGRESCSLKLEDFGEPEYIGYSCGYGPFKIWLSIWIGTDLDKIATNLMIGKEYLKTFERLKGNKHKIEWLFPEEEIICASHGMDNHRIGVGKHVDLSQRENWHTVSVWARENLEKLFWVISIHDAIQQSEPSDSGVDDKDDMIDTVSNPQIASIANDFPYSGAELKAMRERAGFTQVQVALALGLAAGSSAGVGDWEAERLKGPLKHQSKLIALYSTIGDVSNA